MALGEGDWGDVGKGAVVGGGVGSFFGPGGAIVGAGVGGLGGWLFGSGDDEGSGGAADGWTPEGYGWMSPVTGGQKESDIWGAPPLYTEYGTGMAEPTRKPIQSARDMGGQALGQQYQGLGMLRRRAMGEDSVARQAGKREREATQRQILSTARSGRQGPAASRTALMQTSQAGQMISGKVAEAESQERLAAEKAYFAASSGMRGDALKQQQVEQDWWKNKADWERVKKEVFAKYLALGLQDKEAERRARIDLQTLLAEIYNKHLQHKDEMDEKEKEAWMNMVSSGIQAVGPAVVAASSGGGTGSDVRGKTNISKLDSEYADYPFASSLYMSSPIGSNFVSSDERCKVNVAQMPGRGMPREPMSDGRMPCGAMPQERFRAQGVSRQDEIEQLLDNVTGYEFDYKPGFGPPGRHTGVMAQDLEQSLIGASMVSDAGPAGSKVVDYSPGKFNPIAMASLANLNERVRGLESGTPNVRPQPASAGMRPQPASAGMEQPTRMVPQQGALGSNPEEKPDINALKAMMAQMGGRR